MGVRRFTDLRAWQTCVTYKKAVYRLCRAEPLSRDLKLCSQLQAAVAGAASNIAEGFGRFSPPDFARFVVMARASIIESQNHLRDAVDRDHISEEMRLEHDRLAETALQEATGLLEYLRSPEALRNAQRARERRIASRDKRRAEPRTAEQRTTELRTEPEHEPSTENREE